MRCRVVTAILLTLVPLTASSADLREITRVETRSEVAVAPGLWRGHFSGGINYDPPAPNIALAWTDLVAFFPDRGSCRGWIRDMKARNRTYQGYSGCLRIR